MIIIISIIIYNNIIIHIINIALHTTLSECLRKYFTKRGSLSYSRPMGHVHGSVTPISVKYNRRNLNSQCVI